MTRNYKQEYARYQGTPEQKKRRAQRNKVRRQALASGRVTKGSGFDIHHRAVSYTHLTLPTIYSV